MTRLLLTYAGLAERRIATRRALRLSRRGIDVDLASRTAAATLDGNHYDHVLEATSPEPAELVARPGEGLVSIVGARRQPEPAPATVRPAWALPAALALASALVGAGAVAGVPAVLLLLYGVLTAAAATHVFSALGGRRKPATMPVAPTPLLSPRSGAA